LLAVIVLVGAVALITATLITVSVYQSVKQVRIIEQRLDSINRIIRLRSNINKQLGLLIDGLISDEDRYHERLQDMDSGIRLGIANMINSMEAREAVFADSSRELVMARAFRDNYSRLYMAMEKAIELKRAGDITNASRVSEQEVENVAEQELYHGIGRLMKRQVSNVEGAYMKLVRYLPLIPWHIREDMKYERSVGHALDYLGSVNDAEILIHRQMKELREYVLSGDVGERHEFEEMKTETEIAFSVWGDAIEEQMLLGIEGEEEDLELVSSLHAAYRDVLAMADSVISMKNEGRDSEASAYLSGSMEPFLESKIFERINKAIIDGAEEISDAKNSLYRFAMLSALQAFVLLAIFSLSVILILRKMMSGILSSLEKLKTAMAEIGKGKLEHRVAGEGDDELGQLASFVNDMACSLSEVTISRDYMGNILDSMHDCLIVLNGKGEIVSTNEATCSMLHYTRDELEGMEAHKLSGLFHDYNGLADVLVRSGSITNINSGFFRKDGSSVPVLCSMSSSNSPESGELNLIVLAMDFTEQLESSRKLLSAKREWERTLDSIEDPIMLIDRDMRIIRANIALAYALGRDVRDILGLRCHEALVFCSPGCGQCPHKRLMEDGKSHTEEIRDAKTGRIYTVSVSPYFDISGELVGSVHVSKDITKRKQMEEDIIRHHEQLEELVKERTEDLNSVNEQLAGEIDGRRRLEREMLDREDYERRMIGNDLHDGLGQLLTGVSFKAMSLERKLMKLGMEEAGEAENIKELIDQAKVDVKRISGGLTSLGLGEGGLKVALEELSRFVEKVFCVPCDLSYDEDAAGVDESTAYHLFRIAQEAATNAVKYSGADEINLNLLRASGKIILAINDNGVGLPGDVERSGGLGLRIMKHRADLIGATLDISTEGDSGTLVTCVLPVAQ